MCPSELHVSSIRINPPPVKIPFGFRQCHDSDPWFVHGDVSDGYFSLQLML